MSSLYKKFLINKTFIIILFTMFQQNKIFTKKKYHFCMFVNNKKYKNNYFRVCVYVCTNQF